MPDGKTHFKNWKLGWFLVIPISGYLFLEKTPLEASGWLLGYATGAFLDPDLDEIGATNAESRMVNKIPILGYFIYGWSSVYGAIFRRKHRNFWTHFPFFSTIIRIIWFFWWLIPLYYFQILRYEYWQLYFALFYFLGLSYADFLHWLADSLSKPLTNKTKRSKIKKR